jgi:hypothetical protein
MKVSRHTRLLLPTVFASPLQLLADVTGKILGTVSDPLGAAIAGAEITANNAAPGVVQDLVLDGLGLYTFQELAVVRDVLSDKKDGFRDSKISDIVVDGKAAVNNNVVLQEKRK